MMDILADYREWRQQQADRVSTHSDGCHMWHEQCMIHRLAAALAVEMAKRTPAEPSTPGEGTRQEECPYVTGTVTRYCTLTPFTLTDAERFVLREVCAAYADRDEVKANEIAAVIDGLLERTQQENVISTDVQAKPQK